MQSNEILSLNPVINDLKAILSEGKKMKKKVILSQLDDLYIYLRGVQAKSKGRTFHEDEKGNLIEIEVRE